jgi:hypothetical protein
LDATPLAAPAFPFRVHRRRRLCLALTELQLVVALALVAVPVLALFYVAG